MLPTQVFVSISDPRRAWQVRRDLSELLTVAPCCVALTSSPTSKRGPINVSTGCEAFLVL